jgi:hypothetical protein
LQRLPTDDEKELINKKNVNITQAVKLVTPGELR